MSFSKGDVVRIGSGKVEYTVLADVTTADAHIESKNTGKAQTVKADRLTLVREAVSVPADVQEVLDNSAREFERAARAVNHVPSVTATAQDIAVSAATGLVLIIDGHAVLAGKSFDTLAFELSRRAGTYKLAAIARNGRALVERKAA